MGICITAYRARIGSFGHHSYRSSLLPSDTSSAIPSSTWTALILVLTINSITLFTVSKQPVHIHNITGVPCSVSSACSSTPCPIYWRITKLSRTLSIRTSYLLESGIIQDVNFNARYVNGNRKSGGIKMGHINLGSGYLVNNMNSIETIIKGYKPHILGISESSLSIHDDLTQSSLEDYKTFFSKTLHNQNLNVSRISVFTHKDLVVKQRLDLMNDTFSSIWLEVGLPRQRKILICNLYREWQYLGQTSNASLAISAQLDRWLRFLDQWETAVQENKEIHVLVDTNLDFLKWSSSSQLGSQQSGHLQKLSNAVFDRIFPYGFVQLVSVPTRFWPGQDPSGLDHWYTNRPGKLSNIQVNNQGASDHKLLFATRYSKAVISKPKVIRKRSFKNFNPSEFIDAIRSISWWDVYSSEDVEEATRMFTNKVCKILNKMAPVKTIQVRKRYAPWLSPSLKADILKRDQIQREAQETRSVEKWREYKKLRNSVNNKLKGAKKSWQKNKMKEYSSDSRSTWSHVRSFLGWSTGGPPTQLFHDGTLHSKPAELATIMNNFFVDKIRNLRMNLPPSCLNPVDLVTSLMHNRTCSFHLQPVHPDQISKIIDKMKSSKSCGIDTIDSSIIKLVKKELIPVITHLVNLSIKYKVFPKQWKQAKVVPLHKKDDVLLPKNYRPVALLPIVSKILERAVFVQVIDYLETNWLLHPSHHGFRSMHNTSTALLQMFDTWLDAMEDGDISAVIMLDLSAAFDVVDHDILIKKLGQYGVQEEALGWFESYLSGRSQQVLIEGSLSKPLFLDAGVPQGSVLGPLLYVIFTNDLPEAVHDHLAEGNSFYNIHCHSCGGICSFADDSTITVSRSNPTELDRMVDLKYKEVEAYMVANKLVLNSDKTQLLIMTTPSKHKQHGNFGITLNTGTEIVEPTYSGKLLGGFITNDFKFNEHLKDNEKSAFKSLTSRVNALAKICHLSPFRTRKQVANGIVISKISYLIQWWGGCSGYLIKYLQTLQFRAARLVTKHGQLTPNRVVLHQCGWLSVRQMVHYHSLLLVFKIKKENKPEYLSAHFSSVFPYRTRLATGMGVRRQGNFNQDVTKKSFVPRTSSIWNELPASLRSLESTNKFKQNMKSWIIDNVPLE